MTKKVYVSELEGWNVRGYPPVKWKNRVQEYARERGEGSLRNLEQGWGSVWIERDGNSSALAIWWEVLEAGVSPLCLHLLIYALYL